MTVALLNSLIAAMALRVIYVYDFIGFLFKEWGIIIAIYAYDGTNNRTESPPREM